jgi:hypothetical protein
MDRLTKLLYRELYRKSCYEFVKAFWSEADPAPFIDGKLVQFYCEAFQYKCRPWIPCEVADVKLPNLKEDDVVIDVRENKQNLNINVPPRHSKSMIFNVLGPVWLWINAPIKAASVSHTGSLAGQMNKKRMRVINSEKFKFFFGDEVWLKDTPRGTLIDTRGGELYSMPRDSLTGYGADIIINDDLTNAETARRDQAEMASAWAYYQNTMPSRINNRNKYLIMNIQQRLAPNDITGHILSDSTLAQQYCFIVLPAIFSKHTYVVCPITGTVFEFQKGDTLWPERFGNYEALKAEVGSVVFETQYLQNPIASDRTAIKDDMIVCKAQTECPSIDDADTIYASHDFPVKDKDTSDFLGSVLAYKVGSTLYIKDCLEKKMAFVKSVDYVRQLDSLFPGIIQIIEDKANGSPILQQLQDEVAGMQAYQPGTHSKFQRLESASLYMESGNVVFVKTKFDMLAQDYSLTDSLKNLTQRLLAFPFVEHDDIVDAFSQLVLFVFMDKRYMVYGRAFNDNNIVDTSKLKDDYSTVFFNKEGDIWKIARIVVEYSIETKLYVTKELRFKGSVKDGLVELKKFAPDKSVFIDCSETEAMYGMTDKDISVEKYMIDDFDKSVSQMNLAFAKKRVLLDKACHLVQNDIEAFKFSKSKDDNVKYITKKDGFVACLRVALHYFGGIV